ncbi:MAG: hypothetical protein WA949_16585 [Phormidesmis sp.]
MLDLEIKETKVYQEIKEEGREEGQMATAILIAKDLLKTTMSAEDIAKVTRLELSKVIELEQQEDTIDETAADSNNSDENNVEEEQSNL